MVFRAGARAVARQGAPLGSMEACGKQSGTCGTSRGELSRNISSVRCVLHLMLCVERIDLECGTWMANLGGGEAFHPPPPEPELLPCVR